MTLPDAVVAHLKSVGFEQTPQGWVHPELLPDIDPLNNSTAAMFGKFCAHGQDMLSKQFTLLRTRALTAGFTGFSIEYEDEPDTFTIWGGDGNEAIAIGVEPGDINLNDLLRQAHVHIELAKI